MARRVIPLSATSNDPDFKVISGFWTISTYIAPLARHAFPAQYLSFLWCCLIIAASCDSLCPSTEVWFTSPVEYFSETSLFFYVSGLSFSCDDIVTRHYCHNFSQTDGLIWAPRRVLIVTFCNVGHIVVDTVDRQRKQRFPRFFFVFSVTLRADFMCTPVALIMWFQCNIT